MTKEQKWEQFVADYEMEVPETRIANEMNLIRMELRHQMQYDMLTGRQAHLFPDWELDQQQEQIRQQAVLGVKSELVMKELLARLNPPVTREELEEEAAAMAHRQNTTLEMIRGFFGEDLAMLERDIRERKVMDWICAEK